MNNYNKKENYTKKPVFLYATLVFLLLVIFLSTTSKAANIIGPNNRNVTLRTSVNITNAKPEVLSVIVFQEMNVSLVNITLNAGTTRNVTCNASLRDWNGFNDIVRVNATLWDVLRTQSNASDNNNTHYTNSNCTNVGNGVNFTVNYLCTFPTYYYANNGTWSCNVPVMDFSNKTGAGINNTNFNQIFALNLSDGIDYGGLAVETYSNNRTVNITNFGNMPINITVQSYGAVPGDGLAMNCSVNGNITASNQRFSFPDINWTAQIPMTGAIQNVVNLTIPKQTNASVPMTNKTFWNLYVNSANNPAGNCTGFIIFSAESST